ncbi:endodeoxyribonuclease [Elasticomyces elasticus]|nr:endodeoxyribonuclease [Elasticomyces elasticus]
MFIPDPTRSEVVTKIESIFERIADALLNEKNEVEITLSSRNGTAESPTKTYTGVVSSATRVRTRTVSFPGSTPEDAWRFSVVVRILELVHEALLTNVVWTKRDIYYRDPALFGKQAVVDRYVDDIACTFGAPRSFLNIVCWTSFLESSASGLADMRVLQTAAAKGLVAGAFRLHKRDGSEVDGLSDREGILIPSMRDVLSVNMNCVQWIVVIEKEASFRCLTASTFWDKLATRGIMITGKGYPDISTRALLRFLSSSSPQNGFMSPPVYGLMDLDPDGLAILSTYKHGSSALAHENAALVVPEMRWLGLRNAHLTDQDNAHQAQGLLSLTSRDRRKARRMLEYAAFAEGGGEPEWRREVQVMLMLNLKAELQLLETLPNILGDMLEDGKEKPRVT